MPRIILLLSVVALFSCTHTKSLYIVRHAEKLDNTPYSVLSPAGHRRAQVLKDSLIDRKIDLIFVTTFQRTQATAQPLADALHKPLLIHRNNAIDSIVDVLNGLKKKNVLLVSHSGNIPAIIKKLVGNDVGPVPESEYDNLWIIRTRKGKRVFIAKKY
jgi:broad specificity phosphatase PhoE